MPGPSPDHPDYCPGSREEGDATAHKKWHRCRICKRLAAVYPDGTLREHRRTKQYMDDSHELQVTWAEEDNVLRHPAKDDIVAVARAVGVLEE